MGARISVSFKKDDEESVALFSHWGGERFKQKAEKYVEYLKANNPDGDQLEPLDRLEPNTVMVDFIRYLTIRMKQVKSDLYLGKDHTDGDNSDYGHHTIDLDD